MWRRREAWPILLGVALLASCADPALEIPPIEGQLTYVGETLRVPIPVRNPKGSDVTLWFTGPSLANLDRWTTIVQRPEGAEFLWTPTAAHVGVHRFLFVATSGAEHASRGVTIEVRAAREAAPVFELPSPGRVLDLAREPCMTVPVEVRDLDSPTVQLDVAAGLPAGAELATTGPLSAELRWCPAPDQVAASEQWLITLSALDEAHEAVLHDFRVVLAAPHKANCPGRSPEVQWLSPEEGEQVVSRVGYDVAIAVSDETELRDPPLLLWTLGRLEQRDQIDVAHLELEPFRWVDGRWSAHIPSFVLATDEFRTVTMVAWVSDNDDPEGTRCDHHADLRSRRFVARGAVEAGVLPECGRCKQSGDCMSGVCLADAAGGRCVPACHPDLGCDRGRCEQWNAAEGVIRFACGDVDEVCEGLSPCRDDDHEDNDGPETASALSQGEATGVVCHRDADFFSIDTATSSRLTLALAEVVDDPGARSGDLELRLWDESGSIVAVSGSAGDEWIEYCVAAGAKLRAEVHAPRAERSGYLLTVDRVAEDCACRDDGYEPDRPDAPLPAPELAGHEGVICPGNSDTFAIRGDPDVRTRVDLSFESADADLDMDLIGPDGRLVARSQGVGDLEQLEVDLPDDAMYQLRVFAFDGGRAEYLLEVDRESLLACTDSSACGPEEICQDGRCRRVPCRGNLDCPGGHVCPLADTHSDVRTCLPGCESDEACREGEACKAFFEGRACYPAGTGLTAAPCQSAADCAGNRACIDWPGGYCAAAGCDGGPSVCDPDALCAVVDGRSACVVDCWLDDGLCGRIESYHCGELFAPGGELVYGCFPQER